MQNFFKSQEGSNGRKSLSLLVTVAFFVFAISSAFALSLYTFKVDKEISNMAASVGQVDLTPAPKAVITIDQPPYYDAYVTSLTSGYAPFPVFFQGWQSTPREGTTANPQEEIVDYSWDFGDSNSYSGNPNNLKGFNSAHVFEKPGTYPSP